MKIRCTAWVWKDGYIMVDGDAKVDRLPDNALLNEAKPVILNFDVPDDLWEPKTPEINADVSYHDNRAEIGTMFKAK
jgi:hypothetical protein